MRRACAAAASAARRRAASDGAKLDWTEDWDLEVKPAVSADKYKRAMGGPASAVSEDPLDVLLGAVVNKIERDGSGVGDTFDTAGTSTAIGMGRPHTPAAASPSAVEALQKELWEQQARHAELVKEMRAQQQDLRREVAAAAAVASAAPAVPAPPATNDATTTTAAAAAEQLQTIAATLLEQQQQVHTQVLARLESLMAAAPPPQQQQQPRRLRRRSTRRRRAPTPPSPLHQYPGVTHVTHVHHHYYGADAAAAARAQMGVDVGVPHTPPNPAPVAPTQAQAVAAAVVAEHVGKDVAAAVVEGVLPPAPPAPAAPPQQPGAAGSAAPATTPPPGRNSGTIPALVSALLMRFEIAKDAVYTAEFDGLTAGLNSEYEALVRKAAQLDLSAAEEAAVARLKQGWRDYLADVSLA